MAGQPSGTVNWTFDLASVTALEAGGIAPSIIINQPNTFTLTAVLTNIGNVSGALNGEAGVIHYHAMRLDPAPAVMVTLTPVQFNKTPGPSQSVPSLAYTTIGPPSPAGLGVGTWSITAHAHFTNASVAGIVAGFNQILLMVI